MSALSASFSYSLFREDTLWALIAPRSKDTVIKTALADLPLKAQMTFALFWIQYKGFDVLLFSPWIQCKWFDCVQFEHWIRR